MDVKPILDDLKAMGDERAIKIWAKMGMTGVNYYGVNFTKLKEYAKKHKKNAELAQALWDTEVHDARLLATYLHEPAKATASQLDNWVATAPYFDLSDKVCRNVVAKSRFARELLDKWINQETEFIRRSGYITLAEVAQTDKSLTDAESETYLHRIEQELPTAPNWVKEAMNYAIIALGSRNPGLNRTALAVTQKIGKVEVDYGDTSCKLPDAIAALNHPRLLAKFSVKV